MSQGDYSGARRSQAAVVSLVITLFITGAWLVGSVIAFASARSEESEATEALQRYEQKQAQLEDERRRESAQRRLEEIRNLKQQEQDAAERRRERDALERRREQDAGEERRKQEAAERHKEEERREMLQAEQAQERAEAARKRAEDQRRAALKTDHDIIENYIKITPKFSGVQIVRWYDPLKAVQTVRKKEQQGQLYRVAANVPTALPVVNGREIQLAQKNAAVNLYFFIADGMVKRYQVGGEAVKFCKIVD